MLTPEHDFAEADKAALPREIRQSGDADAVARFLAEKGSRVVVSPEQAAQLLRDAGHAVFVREEWGAKHGKAARVVGYTIRLDGKPCTLSRLYDLANKLRAAGGLPPVAGPAEMVAS